MGSYRDFVKRARVHDFKASEPVIFVWERTATAAYSYEIDWEADGRRTRETGNETFVFGWHGGRWLAVSRILLPSGHGG